MAEKKFEHTLARLEQIVKELEKGDLPLEESLKIFEEGVALSRKCLSLLEEAEKKVEILLQEKDGTKRPKPFPWQQDAEKEGEER